MKYLLILALFTCCTAQQKKHNLNLDGSDNIIDIVLDDSYYKPILPSDIFDLIDFNIEVSLLTFENAEYSISPTFCTSLTFSEMRNAFLHNNYNIEYSEDDIRQFYSDYSLLKGDSITSFLIYSENQERVNSKLLDVLLSISPPMVDRKRKHVFFTSTAVFPFKDGIGSGSVIYGYKLDEEDNSWILFCTIDI